MDTDPLLLHRVFHLIDWLEVDEKEVRIADEAEHLFACRGQTYCVLAAEELRELLNARRKPGPQLSTRTLLEKMHLPFVRRLILEKLGALERNPVSDADTLLLSPWDFALNEILEGRRLDPDAPPLGPHENEDPPEIEGRFFIYIV